MSDAGILKLHCLDSSSLAKLFMQEVGSDTLRAYLAAAEPTSLFASALVPLEIYSALYRRFRFGQLSQGELQQAQSSMRASFEQIVSVAVDWRVLRRAEAVIRDHGLRSLDAIQLGTALLMRDLSGAGDSMEFVCNDQQLLFAAQKEDISVWNPAAASPAAHPVN